jgi:hypothetical protein
MKSLAAALCLASVAATANAGGLSDPVVVPVMPEIVIQEEAAASSAPSPYFVLGVAFLAVLATAASN